MKRILFSALLLILIGCGQQKRCTRFVRKNPECFVVEPDTVIKPGWVHDTLFKADTFTSVDTFTQTKENTTIKTVVRWKDRLIHQTIKTSPDTVIIQAKPLPVQYVYKCTLKQTILRFLDFFWWLCILGVIAFGVYRALGAFHKVNK